MVGLLSTILWGGFWAGTIVGILRLTGFMRPKEETEYAGILPFLSNLRIATFISKIPRTKIHTGLKTTEGLRRTEMDSEC